MSRDNDTDVRLAELIWRTVKLRVSLLILTNLVLLVVWSSMASGKKQAAAVDVEFCKEFVAEQNKTTPAVELSDRDWCTASGARTFLEGARAANGILLRGWGSLYQDETTREGATKILKMYNEQKQILDEYDTKRHDAFPLQVQLSPEYSGSRIVLNGQFAATLLPFCALIVFSIVLVLGFQQVSYKRQLESSLPPTGYADALDRATRIARGQFFAGLDTGSHFASWGLISPETLTIGCLYLLFGVALFSVVVSVISDLVHLTDSVLMSYPQLSGSGIYPCSVFEQNAQTICPAFPKAIGNTRAKNKMVFCDVSLERSRSRCGWPNFTTFPLGKGNRVTPRL